MNRFPLAALGVLVGLLATSGAAPAQDAPEAVYELLPVSRATVDSLRRALEPERFAAMLRVNRMDSRRVARADSLVVPGPGRTIPDQPFPAVLGGAASLPKLVVVALRVQAFAAYESGRLVRSGPVSSGSRRAPTPRGLFSVNWKARTHVSTIDTSWVMHWTMNFHAREGWALHQYVLPGLPASHQCVRLLEDDARWLHGWVEPWRVSPDGRERLAHGTPVAIVGAYGFGKRRPWRTLPEDPAATRLRPEELAELDSLLARGSNLNVD